MISKQQVQQIADLARLKLSPKEIKKYQTELSAILGYIDQLKEVDVEGVSPCLGGTEEKNVFREDQPEQLDQARRKKLLQATPEQEGKLIKTRGVFAAHAKRRRKKIKKKK